VSEVSWRFFAVLVTAAGLAAAPLSAQQQRRENRGQGNAPVFRGGGAFHRPPGQHAGDWLRKYKDVPPAQQQKALESDPQFRNLPPERQERLKERLQRFNSLPPERQQRILNRMETWEHLTPDQQQKARDAFGRFRQLPDDRRNMVRSAVRDLQQMSPEDRQRVVNSDRFKSQFTDNERGILNEMSQLPLAPPGEHPVPRPPDSGAQPQHEVPRPPQ
jgi:Protein of unknown function (DUF3106)